MQEVKSQYLAQFEQNAKYFKLQGNKILIERIELGEVRTAGGLIIAESPNLRQDLKLQKPHLAVVLAVGTGYYDAETRSYEPLEVKPGNVVILNANGVQYYSLLPGLANYTANKVGLTTEGDVQLVFDSIEVFETYQKEMQAK